MNGRVDIGYPLVAITDVHGQRGFLERLLTRLADLPGWPRHALVFGGDYVDRGPDVRGTIDLILHLAAKHAGGVHAVAGNHDLALVRAAGLDGRPRSAYWVERFRQKYDHGPTFRAYLGREASYGPDAWGDELSALAVAMPESHKSWLAGLPWLAEASGHVFLHCGLSPDLSAGAEAQLDALRRKQWDRSLGPKPGSKTDTFWEDEYPVWLGADKSLSRDPLPAPGRVQVTGHKPVSRPQANGVRIRLDTSGGLAEPLTACVLDAPDAPPRFVRSNDPPTRGSKSGQGRRN